MRIEEFDPVTGNRQPLSAPPEKTGRALWAAVLLTLSWFLLVWFQKGIGWNLMLDFSVFACLSAASFAAGVYMLTKKETRWRLIGAGTGLASSLLLSGSESVYLGAWGGKIRPELTRIFNFRNPSFMVVLERTFVSAVSALVAALLICMIRRDRDKKQARWAGAAAGGVYLIVSLLYLLKRHGITTLRRLLSGSSRDLKNLFRQEIILPLAAALIIFFVCTAIYSLCHMPRTRVRLRGIGFFWACLALAGSAASLFIVFSVSTMSPGAAKTYGVYTSQLILGLSALLGYALLLCKRRVGLYFILLGVGIILCSLLMNSLLYIGADRGRQLLISTGLGTLNPLFAWLAARAGETPEEL